MKRIHTEDKEPSSGSKKRRRSMSEDEAIGVCPTVGDSLPLSKIYNSACRNNKPAELFRKDLISAMKLPDSEQLDEKDFWNVTDTWKQEWERGVQVPVNSKNVPLPEVREIDRKYSTPTVKLPKKLIHMSQDENYCPEIHTLSNVLQEAEIVCRYDMDDVDSNWLQMFNERRADWGMPSLSEETFELIIQDFEIQCFNKFQDALKTEEGLGIEYDDDVICDVCRNPECEEGNEMVFCDICNICVHQACYGITAIPEGSWVCRTCAANVQPSCVLCPNKGGAMKSTRKGDRWAHVSCALWIPEVVIVDPEKMEPISKISQIPPSRWALICTFCRERVGACIQCCVKQCKVAYHVTCAFENGLEINALYNESREEDGVKLRSYCLKHSGQSREGQDADGTVWKMKTIKKENKASKVSDLEKHNARLQKIREMESEFFKYVEFKQTSVPHADQDVLDFVYNYWKLKRTANYNKPLLPTKFDEAALLGKQPEDSLYARMKMFVHLRQDLERVRNLCYMVSRREKLRRTYIKTQGEIFDKQCAALESGTLKKGSSEFEEVLAATLGNSIYDCIYFGAPYQPPKRDLKDKEPEGEKKKLALASRLPNPYAKLYFNGIHTRSRGSTVKKDSTEAKPTSTETKPVESDGNSIASSAKNTCPVVIRVEAQPEEPKSSPEKHLDEPVAKEQEDKVTSPKEENPSKEVSESEPKHAERNDLDSCKENIPALCEDVKKNVAIIDEESLSDIKNSPSQSDKENVVANPKTRGRKPKNHPESSNELSKLLKDSLGIRLDKQMKLDGFKSIMSSEALKSTNSRGCRYEMRSRNNSTTLLQDEVPLPLPEKPLLIEEEEPLVVLENDPQPVSKSSFRRRSLSAKSEDSSQKEENVIQPISIELSPKRKERFKSHKRRTRRQLYEKISFNDKHTDTPNSLNVDSGDSCPCDTFSVQQEVVTSPLPHSEHTEYKMTMSQNGKVLLSPLRKTNFNDTSLTKDRDSSPSSSCKNDLEQSLLSSPPRDLNCDSSDSQNISSSSSRDLTSSPRLVIKLVKDREKQQWQKQSAPSDIHVFKVVGNDWEMTLDSKDSPLTEAELESLKVFQSETNGPRYMMRSRSKPNS